MKPKNFFVYITTNTRHTVFYTGVTSDLIQRMDRHKGKVVEGFTNRYNADKLVFYEPCCDAESAILREKQIKAGSRKKKLALIDAMNRTWRDLSEKL